MWEAVKTVLTDGNTWQVLIFGVFVTVAVAIASHKGLLSIKARGVRIGSDERERDIIRRQVEWAHLYIMSLHSKVFPARDEQHGYFTKYVLERCYDKAVEWITFNHLSVKNAYIELKQEEICSLVYGLGAAEEFRTPEFKARICAWVRELIEHLVRIREVYGGI